MNIQSEDKKQRILGATMELIAENGLHATPMSQISKRSGVSAGTIYHYFSGKEVLINELYLEQKKALYNSAFHGYDIQSPYEERFFLMWRNVFNYLVARPVELLFMEQCAISPLISADAKEAINRYVAPLAGFITEGIEAGCLKKMDIQLALSFIYGSIVSTAKLQLSEILEITDEYRETAAQICWDGLKAR